MPSEAVKVRDILESEAVQIRIDAGDITREDVEALKSSYNAITVGTVVGMLTGVPVWFAASRRRLPIFTKIFLGSMAVATGGFLGTSIGGFIGAIELRKNMPDYERVFQEITYDIQRAFIERRAGVKTGMVLTHEAGVPGPDREFNPDQPAGAGKIASDPPSSTAVGQALGQQEGGSAWDRLRQTDGRAAADPSAARRAGTTPSLGGSTPGLGGSTPNLGGTTPSLGGNSASTEAEYARRQKDFDAMLERERKGGDDRDKW